MEDGWDEIDCDITHIPSWNKLVFQPKPLTPRSTYFKSHTHAKRQAPNLFLAWENIKPKLEPILRASRELRLIRERNERAGDRRARLCKLVADMGVAEPQFIELGPEHEQPVGPPETLAMPFPDDDGALKLSTVKKIMKEDISGDVAEEKFMAEIESVRSELRTWRYLVTEELSQDLKIKSGFQGLLFGNRGTFRVSRRPQPSGELVCLVGYRGDNLALVALSTKFTAQSEAYMSHSIRKLLRADSVFQLDDNQTCQYFPDIVKIIQDGLLVPSWRHVRSRDSEDSDDGYHRLVFENELPWAMDLSRAHPHVQGQAAAKSLLACLGKPDASHLELKALGKRFVCERCWVKTPMTWAEMVSRFAVQVESTDWDVL
jgi:hypothetical protein